MAKNEHWGQGYSCDPNTGHPSTGLFCVYNFSGPQDLNTGQFIWYDLNMGL